MISKIPAATAEPITPATFGPIACMRRKLLGSAFCPSDWLTRAAIGTADTPAEPISGLIFSLEKRFMNLAKSTPPALPIPKAMIPIERMRIVSRLRNVAPVAVAPTDKPRKITTMFRTFTTPGICPRMRKKSNNYKH